MPASIEVTGAKELRKALRNIGNQDLKNALKAAHKDGAQVVVDAADPPVRSGALRSSVRALGSQREGRAVAGNAGVPYAAAIHWGRKRRGVIVGRPFLKEAADDHRDDIADEFSDQIDRLLDQIRSSNF